MDDWLLDRAREAAREERAAICRLIAERVEALDRSAPRGSVAGEQERAVWRALAGLLADVLAGAHHD